MQTTIGALQQSAVHLSSRNNISQAPASLHISSATRSRRSAVNAPQAFLRGYCGMPSGLNREVQQCLEQLLQASGSPASTSAARELELPLAVDASDEGESYVFVADIPGVRREDLKVQSKDHKLSLSGKRERQTQSKDAEGSKQRHERVFGKFMRQLMLPEDADCNSIKARVDNGVLTVTIGKLAKLPGVKEIPVDF